MVLETINHEPPGTRHVFINEKHNLLVVIDEEIVYYDLETLKQTSSSNYEHGYSYRNSENGEILAWTCKNKLFIFRVGNCFLDMVSVIDSEHNFHGSYYISRTGKFILQFRAGCLELFLVDSKELRSINSEK